MGSGDEIWAFDCSAEVLNIGNLPERTVVITTPWELTPGERGWLDPDHPDNQEEGQ